MKIEIHYFEPEEKTFNRRYLCEFEKDVQEAYLCELKKDAKNYRKIQDAEEDLAFLEKVKFNKIAILSTRIVR